MKKYQLAICATLAFSLMACGTTDEAPQTVQNQALRPSTEVDATLLPEVAEGRFAPRNECLEEPGARAFLQDLRRAVEARDVDAFLALSADDIFLDFGGSSGKAMLREFFDEPEYGLWQSLDVLMELGCASNGERLTMPWFFAQELPPAFDDPYGTYQVIGNDVPLYSAIEGQEVLRSLDWSPVNLVGYFEVSEDGWEAPRWQVALADGTRGYVDNDKLRSLIDYRIGIVQEGGRWQIQNFVAGD